jgi:hypothetical protein
MQGPLYDLVMTIAQERLARFSGLHFTPKRWLHVTTLAVGPVEEFTEADIGHMVGRARGFLGGIPPVRIVLGKILCHPEAIALAVEPTGVLDAVRDAVHASAMNGQKKAERVMGPACHAGLQHFCPAGGSDHRHSWP